MQNILYVSCTAHTKESVLETPLYQSYVNKLISEPLFVYKNTSGLSFQYNKLLKAVDAEFIVFVHDDVYIDDSRVYEKLCENRARYGFDIMGLAGATECRIQYPALWHLMADRTHHRGYVAHPHDNKIMQTSFGPTPCSVLVLDGLFIAVHKESIDSVKWKFNENYIFHHYDISSCIDAHRSGLKLGVVPINVVHNSPGLNSLNDTEWKNSNNAFIAEYGQN